MTLPPNLQVTYTSVTTSGTANTQTTGTLVAAPGANLRYRLWGFLVTPNSTVQAVANWRLAVTDGVAGVTFAQHSGATFAGPPISWFPGGLAQAAANTALGYSALSALVSAVLAVGCFYTIETP